MCFNDYIVSIKKSRRKITQNNKLNNVKWELSLESHPRRQGEGEGEEVGMANLSSSL